MDAPQARADFLRALRHELRTPINHIVGYSELLLESAEDFPEADIVADLRKIDAAGKELLALVNDFFGPARAEEPVEIDLRQVCHKLRTPLNTVIGYSDLLQDESADSGLEGLIADLQRIHRAGTHLLGLVDAVLGLAAAQPDETNGASAIPATQAFALSRRDGVALARPPAKPDVPEACEGRLLVVDDDEMNRDMLARRLERLGYTVECADDGRRALDALRAPASGGAREAVVAGAFDLLLLDVMMPEMNGYQVLVALKADPSLRHLPVIVLSAASEMEDAVRCIELGAEDFLPKPFDPVLLRARIGACLEKKRLRDREVEYLRQIEAERQRSDALLHVILPDEIVDELKATNRVQPRRYENVAVLFCDIVQFTPYCEQHSPQEVVASLQQLVEAYEEITLRCGMQKIKTIGDAFMAAAGLLKPLDNPVLACVRCGAAMIAAAGRTQAHWSVRVGIHVGPVVAGVFGHRQYLFDLVGDTVNTASRMESSGIPDAITLSRAAWEQIARECTAEPLGRVAVKGKGNVELFRFTGFCTREPAAALDPSRP